MSARSKKHPLSVGETVYPRQWYNCPRGGLQQDVEGKAVIMAPMSTPHHYLVSFEDETEVCERGPLDETSMKEDGV